MKSILEKLFRFLFTGQYLPSKRVLGAALPILAAFGILGIALGRNLGAVRGGTITAKGLELRSREGQRRAALSMVKDSAGLSLFDAKGISRMDILVEPKAEPGIWLMNGEALGRAEFSLTLGKSPELSLFAPLLPSERTMLGLNHQGVGYLSIWKAGTNEFWVVPSDRPKHDK